MRPTCDQRPWAARPGGAAALLQTVPVIPGVDTAAYATVLHRL